jgi:hypothetical protein
VNSRVPLSGHEAKRNIRILPVFLLGCIRWVGSGFSLDARGVDRRMHARADRRHRRK